MAKGQMRNLETFKVGSGQVNEFEYQKNQGRLPEQLEHHPDEAAPAKPLTRAERVKQIMAAAHKKVEKKRKKAAAVAKDSSNQKSKAPKSQANTAQASAQKVVTGNLQSGKKKSKKK